MKRILAFLLVAVMCISLCACGEKKAEFNVHDEIKLTVQAKAAAYCLVNYADVRNVMVDTMTTEDNGDGTYDVKGYIVVVDDYGDRYKGKYDAVVRIDMEAEDGNVISFDLETPTKSN